MKKYFLIAIILQSVSLAFSQNEKLDNYLSFTIENDFFYFQKPSDKFYTNGFKLELVGPRFENKNYLLNKLLIKKKVKDSINFMFGFFFGQNMYTPTDITVQSIQIGERPYAGWLYGGVKSISTNLKNEHLSRVTSELYLGVIGPYAFAGETQAFIHKITHAKTPAGWSNQIDSDLGFNYVFRYEGEIWSFPPHYFKRQLAMHEVGKEFVKNIFEINYSGEVNVGTVFNNLALGGLIRLGYMTPYFNSYNFSSTPIIKLNKENSEDDLLKSITKFLRNVPQIFVFTRPQIRYVLGNSMLQGGLANKKSVYTLSNQDVNNLFGQLDYGFTINFRSTTLSYYQSIRTKEYSFALEKHKWGGINLLINY